MYTNILKNNSLNKKDCADIVLFNIATNYFVAVDKLCAKTTMLTLCSYPIFIINTEKTFDTEHKNF